MKQIILLLVCLLAFNFCKQDDHATMRDDAEIVLLISLDGFRHDYLSFAETPNMDELIEEGVMADGLIPIYPSKTFPNHYTQVTGLYPENHGLIANSMYDSTFNEWFFIGNGSEPVKEGKWYEGEPIWVTAKKNNLKSASYFWVGSEAEIAGYRPDYYKEFNSSVPYTNRINEVLEWLKMDAKDRPQFISLYFSLVDSQGHANGPDPVALKNAIESVDEILGALLQGIKDQGKENQVNVMVVSDHGMTQLSRDSMIFLDDYIALDDVAVVNWSPNLDLIPKDGKTEIVYQALKNAHPKLTIYKKSEIPDSLHFKNHRRVTPIVGYADLGWSITNHNIFDNNPNSYQGGTHGFMPHNRDMHGIFFAKGPAFKKGYEGDSFSSIHLYELMCKILDITPAANDGNLEEVKDFLR